MSDSRNVTIRDRPVRSSRGPFDDGDGVPVVRIPVRVESDGTLVEFYGNRKLQLRENTLAELLVSENNILKPDTLDRHTKSKEIPLCSAESLAWFPVRLQGKFRPPMVPCPIDGGYRYVGREGVLVILKEELILRTRGTKKATLSEVKCWIPVLEREANSLNHAYTLISRQFEVNRRSHGGNVFEFGLIRREEDNKWVSLKTLRESQVVEYEKEIGGAEAR